MGDACYTHRLDEAIALAVDAFRYQRRKGTPVPYLTHLLQVLVWVAEGGGDEDQQIAAVLHDYVEDIEGVTLADVERRFGPRVARLVDTLSDTQEHPKPPWRPRKEAHIARIRNAEPEAKLLFAADKLHNVRSMVQDHAVIGDDLWRRFRGGRDGTLWYYQAACDALGESWDHPLLHRLRAEVATLVRLG